MPGGVWKTSKLVLAEDLFDEIYFYSEIKFKKKKKSFHASICRSPTSKLLTSG